MSAVERPVRTAPAGDPPGIAPTAVRILLVGRRAAAHAAGLDAAGARVAAVADAAELERPPGPWDVVVLDGALERERWDRWLLQRIHRALAPGGRLIVSADHVFDLVSPAAWTYLAARAVRQLRRRLSPRGAIPAADRSAFTGRRYAKGALRAMLEGVSFAPIPLAEATAGLPESLASAYSRPAVAAARRLTLAARRLPSVWGEGRPFPEREALRSGYRARHAAAIAARDAWSARHGPVGAPAALEPAAWAARGVLVFSPHPDDEVIGGGGTLLDVVAAGGAVTIVQVTDGSDSAAFIREPEAVRKQVRLDEARRVADGLGARELVCLRADNRALRATPELAGRFRELLERTRAGVVLAPSFTDIHPDHQTVLALLARALRQGAGTLPDVALYEVWSLVAPTHMRDVGAHIDRIEELLLAYETALKVDDYVHLVAERLLFNSFEHRARPGYLEVFEVLPGARFLERARAHFQAPDGAA